MSQPQEEEEGDPNALLGSHRTLHGGEDKLLADQFELHSVIYKKHQIVLLEVYTVYNDQQSVVLAISFFLAELHLQSQRILQQRI